jgi:outer membrane protein assembly factor BamD (BamD/ComL family)
MRLINTVVFLAAALAVFSCATGPTEIPEDLTPAELIQRAQEASDRNRYEVSLQYYETLIERFPFDIDNIIAAEYEIAFIHYKQKKYDIAKAEFTDLLDRYNNPDEELLPQQFKILSLKIMARIEEIENSDAGNPFLRLLGKQNSA